MADAGDQPTRSEFGQRREFHRGDRRVAGHRGEDADADGEPLRAGQHRGRKARRGRVEAVLDHPQLVESVGLQALRRFDDETGGEFACEAHPEVWRRRRSHGSTVEDLGGARNEESPGRQLPAEAERTFRGSQADTSTIGRSAGVSLRLDLFTSPVSPFHEWSCVAGDAAFRSPGPVSRLAVRRHRSR